MLAPTNTQRVPLLEEDVDIRNAAAGRAQHSMRARPAAANTRRCHSGSQTAAHECQPPRTVTRGPAGKWGAARRKHCNERCGESRWVRRRFLHRRSSKRALIMWFGSHHCDSRRIQPPTRSGATSSAHAGRTRKMAFDVVRSEPPGCGTPTPTPSPRYGADDASPSSDDRWRSSGASTKRSTSADKSFQAKKPLAATPTFIPVAQNKC